MPRFRRPLTEEELTLLDEALEAARMRDLAQEVYKAKLYDLVLSGISIRQVADTVAESSGTVFKWVHQERDRREDG